MPLFLHNVVTRRVAFDALAGDAPLQVVRGGEFVTVPGAVVGFLRPSALTFRSPTSIEWGPGDNHEHAPWLLASPKSPVPGYHVLIERPTGLFYAGDAHLAWYRSDGSVASFCLSTALPRDIWVAFGGYPHWLVELNHQAYWLRPDDHERLSSLLRRVLAPRYSHLMLTRYEEDALHLFTNPTKRGWLMYLREPGDSSLYVAAADCAADEVEHFRCDCGTDLAFPHTRTLPVEKAADLVVEFFRSGRLSGSVVWEPQ